MEGEGGEDTRQKCHECDDADVSVILRPCGHQYCYRCMIKRQCISAADNFGKRMKCICNAYVDEHEWCDGMVGQPSIVAHKDPEAI